MGLFGIGSNSSATVAAPAVTAQAVSAQQTLTMPGQAAVPGAMMAQPGGAMSIIKSMLVGGIAGGALGAGVGLLPAVIPVVGPLTWATCAMVGAAGGALMGLVKGLVNRRKANLAMKAQQAQLAPMAGTQPLTVPQSIAGKVHKVGSSGPTVRWTQKALKNLGVYKGKVTGKLDAGTAEAIRRYEVLKGVMPTGDSSPDLRNALAQDIKLSRQFV